MGEALDRVATALGAGASRRATVGGLLAGVAAALPRPAAAGRRRHNHTKKFKKYQEFCQEWCGGLPEFTSCVEKAKEGKGPCYSEAFQGPGFFCTRQLRCGKHKRCCPQYVPGDPVTDGECCTGDEQCVALNSTLRFCIA